MNQLYSLLCSGYNHVYQLPSTILLVEELRGKITGGKEVAEKLERADVNMHNHLPAQLSPTAAIYRLPDEVLLSIFMIPIDELEIIDDLYCPGQPLGHTGIRQWCQCVDIARAIDFGEILRDGGLNSAWCLWQIL